MCSVGARWRQFPSLHYPPRGLCSWPPARVLRPTGELKPFPLPRHCKKESNRDGIKVPSHIFLKLALFSNLIFLFSFSVLSLCLFSAFVLSVNITSECSECSGILLQNVQEVIFSRRTCSFYQV